MSYRVLRYQIPVSDRAIVFMAPGAHVLSVAPSRREALQLDLWARVDVLPENGDAEALVQRVFCVFGTGHEIPDDIGRFIGTVSMAEGRFIGHVFEERAE